MSNSTKNKLSVSYLLESVSNQFQKIPDPKNFKNKSFISIHDHLMSALAVFGLKFPSLLQYNSDKDDLIIKENIKTLYNVSSIPSDTYLRQRLDAVDPALLRLPFKSLLAKLQRAKHLEPFSFHDGHYLLAIDGTGKYSSSKIKCKYCCCKENKNGTTTYSHQLLAGCIVHPDSSNVIPLCPEMIQKSDGCNKNDCERNAAKRFIEHFRREHPHLKVIAIQDGLASNGPYIQFLMEKKIEYILGAKPGDHIYLFQNLAQSKNHEYHEILDEKGVLHQFHFENGVTLNKAHPNLKTNVLEYRQTKNNKELNFSWVTSIRLSKDNVYKIMRGGRSRWKIENETFNTLKNLGNNFKHSYGHGKQHLTSVFSTLMMLSFLIDQIQAIACNLYKAIRKRTSSFRALWGKFRALIEYFRFKSWEEFYLFQAKIKAPDTS